MYDNDHVLTAATAYYVISANNQNKRTKRKYWVRLTLLERNEH